MNRPVLLVVAALTLTTLVPAHVIHLGAWNTANVSYDDNVAPPITDFNDGPRAQFASLDLPAYEAWSYSSFGLQRSYLSMAPDADGLFAGATLAAFNDRLVISAPGVTGRRGLSFLSYTVTGSYGIGGTPSFADLEVTSRLITLGSTISVTEAHFNRNSAGTGTGIDFLGVPQFAIVYYTFGTPFDLQLEIQANGAVNTFGGGRGNLFVDLSHTVLWGGIDDVFLTDDLGNPIGDPITDWSVTSESLSNYAVPYSAAVPEPGTYGMISIVVLSFVVFARRHRRANAVTAVC